MWPWGHFGVAYILYALYSRKRFDRPPRPEPAVAVLFGSQLADLIDKPLQWIGVFPYGRFVAHSLVFAVALITGVYVAAFVFDRVETATAFAIAHLSHLLADLTPRVFIGYPFGIEFLFWPVLSYTTFGFNEQTYYPPLILELLIQPFTYPLVFFLLDVSLFGLGLALWYSHGCPGLETIRSRVCEQRSVSSIE